jgi:glycosyltransferase involved in cell wall biosynthesis
MERKSITILGPSVKFLSGISYYTIRLSNALSSVADVKAVLFRKMLPKRLFPGWKRVGDELTALKFNENVDFIEILDWYNPVTWFRGYLVARKSDFILLQWWTSSVAHIYLFLEVFNKIFSRKKIVIEFHEVVDPLESSILPIRIYSKIMGRLIRKLASHYVVHSNADRMLIAKAYKIPETRVTVIPHGIYDHYSRFDKEIAKERLNIEEDFVILFFGLLRPYKGVRYLIKAFEMLPEDIVKSSRLLIVGEEWEDKETLKLAEDSVFSNKITVINKYVPDEDISLLFSAADVVVLPYTRASQSGVAHIAMSFGLPVIAAKVGGISESLEDYSGTFFIPPENSERIAEKLVNVYKNRNTFNPPEKLKWENIASLWLDLFEIMN